MPHAIKNEKNKKSSPDYPLLARTLLETFTKSVLAETSLEASMCKLPPALYIVATPIGNLGDISLRALVTLMQVDCIACEDTRTSGAMLAKYGIKKTLISYHDHNDDQRRPDMLKRLAAGEAIALISDAGMPLIADPGYKMVRDCNAKGYKVIVIPGANAAITALAGSGLPTDAFHFAGFLPPKKTARQKALSKLKNIPATLILYEAPQRLAETLVDLAEIFGTARSTTIAREITKLFEETRSGSLEALAAFYQTNNARGEIVIVIAPPQADIVLAHDLDALLKKALKTESLRDAVAAVSKMTGIKKSDVYKMALTLNEKA